MNNVIFNVQTSNNSTSILKNIVEKDLNDVEIFREHIYFVRPSMIDRENNKIDIIDGGKHILYYTNVINSQQNIYLPNKINDGLKISLSNKYIITWRKNYK